jgi:hypothetical protein
VEILLSFTCFPTIYIFWQVCSKVVLLSYVVVGFIYFLWLFVLSTSIFNIFLCSEQDLEKRLNIFGLHLLLFPHWPCGSELLSWADWEWGWAIAKLRIKIISLNIVVHSLSTSRVAYRTLDSAILYLIWHTMCYHPCLRSFLCCFYKRPRSTLIF